MFRRCLALSHRRNYTFTSVHTGKLAHFWQRWIHTDVKLTHGGMRKAVVHTHPSPLHGWKKVPPHICITALTSNSSLIHSFLTFNMFISCCWNLSSSHALWYQMFRRQEVHITWWIIYTESKALFFFFPPSACNRDEDELVSSQEPAEIMEVCVL